MTRRGWLRQRWHRLNGPERIAGVDLARGLAVLGMLAAHLLTIDVDSWLDVVNGRSSILFATLAGVSIGLVTGGVTPVVGQVMVTARLRLLVRAALLWALGIALILTGVPVYVILPGYAILFLLATALLGLRARILFAGAVLLALGMPVALFHLNAWPGWQQPLGELASNVVGWHYPFPLWIAFVAAGLGAARAGIMRPRVQLWLLGVGSALAILGAGLGALAREDGTMLGSVWTAEAHASGVGEAVGSGGFALAVLGGCLLLSRVLPVRILSLPLRAVGAMPLTAYTAHLLAWAVLALVMLGDTSDLGGIREAGVFAPLTVAIVLACTAWALLVGRGPLEWVVDRVTRLTVREAEPASIG